MQEENYCKETIEIVAVCSEICLILTLGLALPWLRRSILPFEIILAMEEGNRWHENQTSEASSVIRGAKFKISQALRHTQGARWLLTITLTLAVD